MSKVIMIILNVLLGVGMLVVLAILIAWVRHLITPLFDRFTKKDSFDGTSKLPMIIAIPIGLLLVCLLILAADRFFWPLRHTAVGWTAHKIQHYTGLKKSQKVFQFEWKNPTKK